MTRQEKTKQLITQLITDTKAPLNSVDLALLSKTSPLETMEALDELDQAGKIEVVYFGMSTYYKLTEIN